eukprot:7376559-Prymnesium_polylepis.1
MAHPVGCCSPCAVAVHIDSEGAAAEEREPSLTPGLGMSVRLVLLVQPNQNRVDHRRFQLVPELPCASSLEESFH